MMFLLLFDDIHTYTLNSHFNEVINSFDSVFSTLSGLLSIRFYFLSILTQCISKFHAVWKTNLTVLYDTTGTLIDIVYYIKVTHKHQ